MSAQLTVSLTDDRADTRALWRRVLARQGDLAVLDEFTDAALALAQLPDRLPAVLLVDWHLGDGLMDGLEPIRLLKTDHPQLCCPSGLPSFPTRAAASLSSASDARIASRRLTGRVCSCSS